MLYRVFCYNFALCPRPQSNSNTTKLKRYRNTKVAENCKYTPNNFLCLFFSDLNINQKLLIFRLSGFLLVCVLVVAVVVVEVDISQNVCSNGKQKVMTFSTKRIVSDKTCNDF